MSAGEIETLAVVGGGLMGRGIAQVATRAGIKVHLVEVDQATLDRAREALLGRLRRWASQDALGGATPEEIVQRIVFSVDVEHAVADVDFVIEAISERLDWKQAMFRRLDAACRPGVVLGSNTSQLRIQDLAAVTSRPELVIGTHFFNPPDVMQLVEVVVAEQTAPETVTTALALAGRLGKQAVVCRDMQGFVTSRIIAATLLEGIRLMEDGVASPVEIDRACRLAFNWPMGPLELSDYVGLDTLLFSSEGLRAAFGDRFEAPAALRKLVEDGALGRKTGRGLLSEHG